MPDTYERLPHCLGFIVPALDASYINASDMLAREYGIVPRAAKHHAHITAKYDLDLTSAMYRALRTDLPAITAGIGPFRVRAGSEIGCFEETGTLYLPIEDNQHDDEEAEPTPFRRALELLLAHFDRWNYPRARYEGNTLHVTYASGIRKDLLSDARQRLLSAGIPFSTEFTIDTLALFVQERRDAYPVWHVRKEFPLGTPS